MAFTLAYLANPVPAIPDPDRPRAPRPADRREHFGSETDAMRRVAELLPGEDWLDLRLYGPDGRRIADQGQLAARLSPPPPREPRSAGRVRATTQKATGERQ